MCVCVCVHVGMCACVCVSGREVATIAILTLSTLMVAAVMDARLTSFLYTG